LCDMTIGDGDNDGRTELFTADYDGHIYKFSKGNAWNGQDIGMAPGGTENYTHGWWSPEMHALAIGDGDNDGNNEIYGANSNNHLYRFNYSGNSWNRTDMGTPYEPLPIEAGAEWGMWAIAIGDVDSDGKNEVYASSVFDEIGNNNGTLWQYKRNPDNASWNLTKLDDLDWGTSAMDFSIGDCDGDGYQEIYAGLGTYYNQGIIENIWFDPESHEWNSESVGTSDGSGWKYFTAIAIGSATNDTRQNEIYAACANGHAYQFLIDNFPPMNPLVWSDSHPTSGTTTATSTCSGKTRARTTAVSAAIRISGPQPPAPYSARKMSMARSTNRAPACPTEPIIHSISGPATANPTGTIPRRPMARSPSIPSRRAL
jgi:hypothetical protein